MSFESRLRTDILGTEITTEPDRIKVIVETQFNELIRSSEFNERMKTPGKAKNIVEAMELVGEAIEDYQERTNKNADARVFFTYHKPDTDTKLEAISVHLIDREPGVMSRTSLKARHGADKVRNLRPLTREITDDPDNPGYKRAILGYFYDNTIRLTCWARTNKAALERMMWLEEVMEQYQWFFQISGVSRVLYDGRGDDEVVVTSNNKIYGVSMDFFVRTERLRAISQKTLEEIYIKFASEAA